MATGAQAEKLRLLKVNMDQIGHLKEAITSVLLT